MPKIEFVLPAKGGERAITQSVDVEFIPRIGEHLSFDNGGDGAHFVVEDVSYWFIMDRDEKIEESERPKIYLRKDE